MTSLEDAVSAIWALIVRERIVYGNENELQELIQKRLNVLGDGLVREHRLSLRDRPDFFFVPEGLAIEVKIKGSPSSLFTQLERYSQHSQVQGILLIRHRIPFVSGMIGGKPLFIRELWKHQI